MISIVGCESGDQSSIPDVDLGQVNYLVPQVICKNYSQNKKNHSYNNNVIFCFCAGHLDPPMMNVVHSLALDEEKGRLFVADRENMRVLEFDATKGDLVSHLPFNDPVYAVAVNKKGRFLL